MLGILFAELAPILRLFAVFGHVTVKLLPYKGRVYFSNFETGMDYEFLFVLANKHGGSDSVLNHALSFQLLTLRCWLSCVKYQVGLPEEETFTHSPLIPPKDSLDQPEYLSL